jgi:predicted XRE-type DNA-binding protein
MTAPSKKPNSKIQTQIRHVTPAGGNVYLDLGFETEEADRLKVQAEHIISTKIAIRESLMNEVANWIKSEVMTQAEAAQVLGVTRPRVSDIINKKWTKFTIDALIDLLARAGKQIQLNIK